MLKGEFEALTNFNITDKEYDLINKQYIESRQDKETFCKQWIKNGGIGEILKSRADGNVEIPPVYRYAPKELMLNILKNIKNTEEFQKASAILDEDCEYTLMNALNENTKDDIHKSATYFTNYEFNITATVACQDWDQPELGAYEIWLCVDAKGKFSEDDKENRCYRHNYHLGIFQTRNTDLDSMKIMAELGGAINYFGTQFVNENIKNFTPTAELMKQEITKAKNEYLSWLQENYPQDFPQEVSVKQKESEHAGKFSLQDVCLRVNKLMSDDPKYNSTPSNIKNPTQEICL